MAVAVAFEGEGVAEANIESRSASPRLVGEGEGDVCSASRARSLSQVVELTISLPPSAAKRLSTVMFEVELALGSCAEGAGLSFAKSLSSSDMPPFAYALEGWFVDR